jgi:hypothetical protein
MAAPGSKTLHTLDGEWAMVRKPFSMFNMSRGGKLQVAIEGWKLF